MQFMVIAKAESIILASQWRIQNQKKAPLGI